MFPCRICFCTRIQLSASLGVGRLLLVCAERTEKGYLSSPKLSAENIRKQLQTGEEPSLVASCISCVPFHTPRQHLSVPPCLPALSLSSPASCLDSRVLCFSLGRSTSSPEEVDGGRLFLDRATGRERLRNRGCLTRASVFFLVDLSLSVQVSIQSYRSNAASLLSAFARATTGGDCLSLVSASTPPSY